MYHQSVFLLSLWIIATFANPSTTHVFPVNGVLIPTERPPIINQSRQRPSLIPGNNSFRHQHPTLRNVIGTDPVVGMITRTEFMDKLVDSTTAVSASIEKMTKHAQDNPVITTVGVVCAAGTWIYLSLPRYMVMYLYLYPHFSKLFLTRILPIRNAYMKPKENIKLHFRPLRKVVAMPLPGMNIISIKRTVISISIVRNTNVVKNRECWSLTSSTL